jgi:hypothetical protein
MDFGVKDIIKRIPKMITLIFECCNLVDPLKGGAAIFWGWFIYEDSLKILWLLQTLIFWKNDFLNYAINCIVLSQNKRKFRDYNISCLVVVVYLCFFDRSQTPNIELLTIKMSTMSLIWPNNASAKYSLWTQFQILV